MIKIEDKNVKHQVVKDQDQKKHKREGNEKEKVR